MFTFIVNPASRSGLGIEVWKKVEEYLKSIDFEYEASFSQYQGNVQTIMNDLCKKHIDDDEPVNVIILGGDGTMDEALQGVIDFSKVNIGYIPTGSSNDFARALGYPLDPVEAVKSIIACESPRSFDLGKLEYLSTSDSRLGLSSDIPSRTRYFDVSCGVGFDAAVCKEALNPGGAKSFLNKIGLGKLIYLKIALHVIFKGIQPDGKLILSDGTTVNFKKLRFMVGMNTCYEGGGYKFAPDAVGDDGFLDLCLASNLSAFNAFLVLPRALKGKHVTSKSIKTYHTQSYELMLDEPLWVHTDGEVYAKSTHIKVSCIPGLLRLLY